MVSNQIDDNTLLQQLQDASTRQQAFAVLVKQYGEQLYWKIRRIVLIHEDADDVLQNTFIKVWNNLDDFRGNSKLSTWLYRIAINEALDFLRKQKTRISQSADADLSVANRLMADEYFDGDHIQAELQAAIATLPDVQRTVFNLRYFDQMKYADISKILDTSEGALKASYHLAVKKISEYLKRRE